MIVLGNIGILSNRATWTDSIDLRKTNRQPLNISDVEEINMSISSIDGRCDKLTAKTDDDAIVVADSHIIEWTFPVEQMRTLSPGNYSFGMTAKFSNETIQILVGTFCLVDGIVS